MNFGLDRSSVANGNEFDLALDRMFSASRRYRTRFRSGTVVVVDRDDTTYRFLHFLALECKIDMRVVRIDTTGKARELIQEIGGDLVKVVIISAELVSESANGGSLPMWLNENCQNIPVWISKCDSNKRRNHWPSRVGIVESGEPLEQWIDSLGLPEVCRDAAVRFIR